MSPGQQALACYRLGHWLLRKPWPMRVCLEGLYQLWSWQIRRAWGIAIDRCATIGPDCYIGHFGGIFVGEGVTIGARCHLSQDVTIGEHDGSPTIGDDVYLGPGVKVYGKLTIGNNAKVGPNAVIYTDVDADSIVAVPRFVVLSHRGNKEDVCKNY